MLDIQYNLDIPFKNFQAGQIIESIQFNDDMAEIEEKVNEIIGKHNSTYETLHNHVIDLNNPHQITPTQIGTYTLNEIDDLLDIIRNGGLNQNSITNFLLADDSIDTRNLKNNSITSAKADLEFGTNIDISRNTDITGRYTKAQVDQLLIDKVGEGTYSKAQIDTKFSEVQAGQIVDSTIGVEKLKTDVGTFLDITSNPSILEQFTNEEINELIVQNGLPKDWGTVTDTVTQAYGSVPVAGLMTAGSFTIPLTTVLDLNIKEVIEARSTYANLSTRLEAIENSIISILNMFSEVTTNGTI